MFSRIARTRSAFSLCEPLRSTCRAGISCWRPSLGHATASTARGFSGNSKGPDHPEAKDAASMSQPRWPAHAWHDHLQYHFFFDGLFVQARVFMTKSLEEHSLWIFDHATGKVEELVNSAETLTQSDGPDLDITGPRLHIRDGPGGGALVLKGTDGSTEMELSFQNKNVISWLPAGASGNDNVIHRPDLHLKLKYRGEERVGRGYSKRYFGDAYGPQWGYRFIQSSWLDGRKFLWTADATFRLGNGEAKYNYFKLLDSETGELVQADSKDTYQQDCAGYGMIDGKKYVATITPLGEWCHDYKAGETNSRMQLRYCKLELSEGEGSTPVEGYALNERCFGTLG